MAPSADAEAYPIVLSGHSFPTKAVVNASVLHGKLDLRLETRNIEEPSAGELQIQVRSTGICGSDVSYYKKFANGDLIPDHVSFDAAALLEPLSVAIHSLNRAAPTPGSTAVVIGAGTVGLLVAAMARQSGCTFVTILDRDAGRVEYAVEKGFATHGFVVPQTLHSSSSSSSIFTDGTSTPASCDGIMTPLSAYSNVSDRLEGAKALAADVLAVARPDMVTLDEDEDDGVDVTFECTGKEPCMQTALYATKPGGKVIMVGMGTPIQTVPLSAAQLREVDILGIFRYANTYQTGIRLLGGKGPMKLPSLDDMVTHKFKGLGNAKEAFELAGRTVDDEGKLVLKVVIEA